jgi:hypothetical protein
VAALAQAPGVAVALRGAAPEALAGYMTGGERRGGLTSRIIASETIPRSERVSAVAGRRPDRTGLAMNPSSYSLRYYTFRLPQTGTGAAARFLHGDRWFKAIDAVAAYHMDQGWNVFLGTDACRLLHALAGVVRDPQRVTAADLRAARGKMIALCGTRKAQAFRGISEEIEQTDALLLARLIDLCRHRKVVRPVCRTYS